MAETNRTTHRWQKVCQNKNRGTGERRLKWSSALVTRRREGFKIIREKKKKKKK